MRRAVKGAVAAVVCAGALAVGAGTADAGFWNAYNTVDGGVALRYGPSTSYGMNGRGYGDQHPWTIEKVRGQSIHGNNLWDHDDHYLADWTYWGRYYSADYYMVY
ncbi:hypothetical protein [Amycolatopsis speibonae]|uniref:Lactococcin 972 family bacteriocin n=1 Tax=Amycolatopsis speibonae TaxID=1450224 RepID=A0ABV7P020_9PSEU